MNLLAICICVIPNIMLIFYDSGSGAFGEVFSGILTKTQNEDSIIMKNVAIKIIKSNEANFELLKEAMASSRLKHDNIVEFIGICMEYNCIVLELMEGGQLLEYLESKKHQLTLWDLVDMSHDVAKGCHYLEKSKFVHRDLAARNCMLTSTNSNTRKVKS